MLKISSLQNPFIKSIIFLQEKSKVRLNAGIFVIEGRREIKLAMQGNYEIETILFDSNIFFEDEILNFFNPEYFKSLNIVSVSHEVYQKIAYRDSTEGIIAVAKTKTHFLGDIKLSENPLVLVVESFEKPGNIGAILRTADAAKIDAIIIANLKTDLYNPNVIRSSVGSLFTNQIAIGETSQIINFLIEKKINIYCATLQNSNFYDLQNFTKPTAIIMGNESIGLSDQWRNAAYKNIKIPMQGQIDSMNVSVAAAIIIFEAKRQRGFKD